MPRGRFAVLLLPLLLLPSCRPAARPVTGHPSSPPPAPLPLASYGEAGIPNPGLPFRQGTLRLPGGGQRQVTYQVVRGRAVFQGDIDLGPVDAQGNLIFHPIQTAGGVTEDDLVWPDCTVPWESDGSITPTQQALIQKAIDEWESDSPCLFVPHTTEADYVVFTLSADDSGYSNSPVGRQGGSQQILVSKSAGAGNIMHEMGHALGLIHEHTRPDRDRFITINTANIKPGFEYDFDIPADSQAIGVYDYGSIMHYPANAISNGMGPTITAPTGVSIGQRSRPSAGDVSGVMELQGMPLGWSVFAPQLGPAAVSQPNLGPFQEEIYYQSFVSAGVDYGIVCRRHNFTSPIPPDCMTFLPPEPLSAIPTSCPTPFGMGDVSIFVRGNTSGSYLHFRRDYLTDPAGGVFHLEPGGVGSGWFSSPAALTLGSRILLFGVRDRTDHPGEASLQLMIKDYADGTNTHPWTGPIEFPLPAGHAIYLDPAVVSNRPNAWTLFTFDTDGVLWGMEGDPTGHVVTAWKEITGFDGIDTPYSGPAVLLTSLPNTDFLVLVSNPASRLGYAGVDKNLHLTASWQDVGGFLDGRPAAAAYPSGTQFGVLAKILTSAFWFRSWDPLSHVIHGGI
jgi:Astacin (Peptidase family M12A)